MLNIVSVGKSFGLKGDVVSAQPYGSGHINDTYSVLYSQAGQPVRYIFQRINKDVFRSVPSLMENIGRVTDHLRSKLESEGLDDLSRRVLTPVKTAAGANFLKDSDGEFWRVYYFIENARTYDRLTDVSQAKTAAAAFAGFQRGLADLPGGPLSETIPDFHHTVKRFRRLKEVVADDPLGRVALTGDLVEGYSSLENFYGLILSGIEDGSIPLRVTHNDTKLNNVMIDDSTGEGICVIDLDTVMTGSVLYDFGDMVRSATNAGMEDDSSPERVFMREDVFEALVEGYLQESSGFISDEEVKLLARSGIIITLEIGMRFLTDFIEGDVYFKKRREGHNLDRARNQLVLAQSMVRRLDWMEDVVERNFQR